MRILIASDLHGSAYYTRKLLEAWDRENPDRTVLLGDLIQHKISMLRDENTGTNEFRKLVEEIANSFNSSVRDLDGAIATLLAQKTDSPSF